MLADDTRALQIGPSGLPVRLARQVRIAVAGLVV